MLSAITSQALSGETLRWLLWKFLRFLPNTSDEKWNRELFFFCRPAKFYFSLQGKDQSTPFSGYDTDTDKRKCRAFILVLWVCIVQPSPPPGECLTLWSKIQVLLIMKRQVVKTIIILSGCWLRDKWFKTISVSGWDKWLMWIVEFVSSET